MTIIWSVLLAFWRYIPWVFIAMMAFLSFRKRPDSRSLLMQTIGSAAMFLLGIIRWAVGIVVGWATSSSAEPQSVTIIFEFLMFAALTAFAIGYCLERFRRK